MSFNIVPLAIILFSLVFVGLGAWVLLRQQWFLQWVKGTAGLLLVLVAVYMSFFALNLFGYHQLSKEAPVATVSFRKVGPQDYMATVSTPKGQPRDYELKGDLWELDARIIKWKGLFALLGVKPGYQLDRISGRYLSLEDERSRKHSVYDLHGKSIGFDIWESAHNGWSMMIDARYGSATYLPMADGAIFEVKLSNSGLVGRPLNGSAQQAINRWD